MQSAPLRLPPQAIPAAHVDVWSLCLRPAEAVPPDLHALLDREEQARAARLLVPEHRPRFVLAHAMLRLVLSAYGGGADPLSLVFGLGPHGKPYLKEGSLGFNLSHSHDAVVLAVAQRLTVGVDVERLRFLDDRDGLVRRYFSPRERAAFAGLPASERNDAFFRLWTRKEAHIKALGDGLQRPLHSFSVSADMPARLLEPALPGWSLHHLEPAPGYVGALAVEHPAPTMRMRRLTLSRAGLVEAGADG